MKTRFVSWLMIFVSVATALAQTAPIQTPVAAYVIGTSLRIRTVNRRKLEGRLESKDAQDFAVRTSKDDLVRVAYTDVQSVELIAKKKSGKTKWIVIAAVGGAVVVVGAIFAARLRNEGNF